MNIVVCVKQTPIPAEAHLDAVTRAMVREGVALTISSIDRRALLEGLRVRGVMGGSVTVLTMGPPDARVTIEECLALGADEGIHSIEDIQRHYDEGAAMGGSLKLIKLGIFS